MQTWWSIAPHAMTFCWWRLRFGQGPSNKRRGAQKRAKATAERSETQATFQGRVIRFGARRGQGSCLKSGAAPGDNRRQTKWQRSSTQSAAIASRDFKETPACVANKRLWAFLVLVSQKPPVDFLVSHRYPLWRFPWFFFFSPPWQWINSSGVWRAVLLRRRLAHL